MVYNMGNLREAGETTKHVLSKEQIDGHKSGQSAASPFMKVNQQNPKRKSVSFNELSSKLDRKENSTQYKPRIHPGRNRGCG